MTQFLKDTISELTSIYASGRVTINCLDQIVSALVILITIVVKAIAFVEQKMPTPVFLALFENPHEFFKKNSVSGIVLPRFGSANVLYK